MERRISVSCSTSINQRMMIAPISLAENNMLPSFIGSDKDYRFNNFIPRLILFYDYHLK